MAASSAEELEGMEGVGRQEGRLARRPLAGEGGGREARAMALLQAVVERMVEEVTEAGAKVGHTCLHAKDVKNPVCNSLVHRCRLPRLSSRLPRRTW